MLTIFTTKDAKVHKGYGFFAYLCVLCGKKEFLIFGIVLFFVALAGCDSVFFYPTKEAVVTPDQIEIKYQPIKIDDGNGPVLYGWFMPAQGKTLGTILHFHGNAENISTHLAGVYWLPAQGFNVFMLDYRGYGASQGAPTIKGILEDGLRATKFIQNYPGASEPLILFGQSLGGSVALYVAAQPETKGVFKVVVAESPFASYRGIVRQKLSQFWITYLLKYPLSWTISSQYDVVDRIDDISPTPLLLVHPVEDEIVPVENSEILFEKAGEPKEFWKIEGVEHIQSFKYAYYRKQLINFIKKYER